MPFLFFSTPACEDKQGLNEAINQSITKMDTSPVLEVIPTYTYTILMLA